jgi:hypothetical protein
MSQSKCKIEFDKLIKTWMASKCLWLQKKYSGLLGGQGMDLGSSLMTHCKLITVRLVGNFGHVELKTERLDGGVGCMEGKQALLEGNDVGLLAISPGWEQKRSLDPCIRLGRDSSTDGEQNKTQRNRHHTCDGSCGGEFEGVSNWGEHLKNKL